METLKDNLKVKTATKPSDGFVAVAGRIKVAKMANYNQRLALFDLKTTNQLVNELADGTFPERITKAYQEQIESLKKQVATLTNGQMTGQVTAVQMTGQNMLEFCAGIHAERFYEYLVSNRTLTPKYAQSCVSYFDRYTKAFWENPSDILKLTPHKRAWVLCAMRNFGHYTKVLTQGREVQKRINEHILLHDLNRDLDHKHRMFMVEDSIVNDVVRNVFSTNGQYGYVARIGLSTGIREDELLYIHDKPICERPICRCDNLHVSNKPNGISIIQVFWFRRKKKCYITVMPTKLWQEFRAKPFTYPMIKTVGEYLKRTNEITYHELRHIHFNVMVKSKAMAKDGAEVLAGRAKDISVQHYQEMAFNELAEQYITAWSKFGVDILNQKLV